MPEGNTSDDIINAAGAGSPKNVPFPGMGTRSQHQTDQLGRGRPPDLPRGKNCLARSPYLLQMVMVTFREESMTTSRECRSLRPSSSRTVTFWSTALCAASVAKSPHTGRERRLFRGRSATQEAAQHRSFSQVRLERCAARRRFSLAEENSA